MQYKNIYQLFRAQIARYGDAPVFYARGLQSPALAGGASESHESWTATSWNEFGDQVHDFACALTARGLTPGASVAILAGNVPEWTIADVATIAAGGTGVGIYPTSSPQQCAYIINHSDAEFLLVDSYQQFEKVMEADEPLPKLKEIVCLKKPNETPVELAAREKRFGAEVKDTPVTYYRDFLRFGREKRAEFLPQIEKIGFGAQPDEIAIMVYTSGTTGNPKGARLSHRYVLNSVESLRQTIPLDERDVTLSYLPACHVAERISGIYNRLYNGTSAYFVDDLTKLYAAMLEVRPTVFASLPRFFEKIYAKVVAERGAQASAQDLKNAFGGRVRLLTSGGAPLPNEVAGFFAARDLPILQAYGLTENICVAFNRADDFKFGTVGRPMPQCDVRFAADGEILVKSPMMFSGYHKAPEQTAAMFDENGWLKTGDLGSSDADGFLRITGRKKEIIVLSSGKNVAPALVENLLKENHLVSQAFAFGDGKSYLTALITLNQAETEAFARANRLEFTDFADLLRNEIVLQQIKTTVERANARVASSEQIKRYEILARDFSAELGEITPTLKLKRDVVAKNFAAVIESLYNR